VAGFCATICTVGAFAADFTTCKIIGAAWVFDYPALKLTFRVCLHFFAVFFFIPFMYHCAKDNNTTQKWCTDY